MEHIGPYKLFEASFQRRSGHRIELITHPGRISLFSYSKKQYKMARIINAVDYFAIQDVVFFFLKSSCMLPINYFPNYTHSFILLSMGKNLNYK
ncbi:hypothetical protein C0J52_23443 [Blattella germanica]|nr:hypothetical protein C0J52_23443 [Blattella germanica]